MVPLTGVRLTSDGLPLGVLSAGAGLGGFYAVPYALPLTVRNDITEGKKVHHNIDREIVSPDAEPEPAEDIEEWSDDGDENVPVQFGVGSEVAGVVGEEGESVSRLSPVLEEEESEVGSDREDGIDTIVGIERQSS
jgi:hypothetical protein